MIISHSQMNSHNIWDNSMGFGPVSMSPGLATHMEVRSQLQCLNLIHKKRKKVTASLVFISVCMLSKMRPEVFW